MSIIPFSSRITVTIKEAEEASGLGRTKLYELIKQGRLKTTKVDKRTLVIVSSMLSLLEVA